MMKRWVRSLGFLAAAMAGGAAHATINCNLSSTSASGTYAGANVTVSGSITLTCTRASSDASTQGYWVGIDDGTTGTRQVVRIGGSSGTNSDRLNVSIYKSGTTTSWTASGTGRVAGTLSFGGSLSASVGIPYDLFAAKSQNGKTAGILEDLFTVSLQLLTAGPIVATTTFDPSLSIPTVCFVGQVASGNLAPGAVAPSTLSLAYSSFTPAAQTANMNFTVDCTNGTPYSLALSPASGTLLGLNYSLALSGTTGTGNGFAQGYTVTATVPANQSGTCSTATCTATQPTVITLTY